MLKEKFYRLIFQDDMNLYKTIMKEVRKLGQYNQTTILWILSQIERRNNYKYPQYKKRLNNLMNKDKRNRPFKNKDMYQDITSPQSNISSKREISKRVDSTLAFNVEHEIRSRNNLTATDIEKGWIIDSGASPHVTPFFFNISGCKIIS